jgi:hypothetical protein
MNDRALRAVFRAIGRDICAGRGPARALQAVCFRGNGGVPQGPDQWHGGRSGGVSKAGRGRRRRCTRRPSRLVATNADGPQPEGADDEAQGSGRAVRRNGSSDPGGFTAAHTCPTGIFVPVAGRLTSYWACRSRCVPNNASEPVGRAASRLWVGVRGIPSRPVRSPRRRVARPDARCARGHGQAKRRLAIRAITDRLLPRSRGHRAGGWSRVVLALASWCEVGHAHAETRIRG